MDLRLLKVIVFLLHHIDNTSSQTYDEARNLRSTLLSGYNKDIRPLNNQSSVLNVNVTMILYGMPEIDGVKGVLRMTVATPVFWIDERISWNVSDHGGISKIPIPSNEVWTPSVTLATPAEFAVMGSSKFHVTFHSNGLAVFFPGAVLESSCRFNMKFWPFDKQLCDVGFLPLDYGTDQVLFSVPPDGINTKFYNPNAEWTLDDTSYYIGETSGFSTAFFRLKLQRQSLFYVLTIILPINGIIGLTCLVFLLPNESGERVSYAITIMLSLAVFLTVVSEEIPKTSEPISLMCCYILAGMIVSIIGTIAAILNLNIYHRNENIPKRTLYILLVRLSRCKQNTRVQDISEEYEESKVNQQMKNVPGSFPQKRNASKIKFVSVESSKLAWSEKKITWHDVSHALDKLLFYIMVILAYIPSLCFLIYLYTATDYQQK